LTGHQWDQDRKIAIYNELTPGVDEDKDLMFKEPEKWDWQPTRKELQTQLLQSPTGSMR